MAALRPMSDWLSTACTPNPYSSHINVIYIKGVWQPLYAVDVHMDVYLPPEDVPNNSQFLLEIIFTELWNSHLETQTYWTLAMDAAITAKKMKCDWGAWAKPISCWLNIKIASRMMPGHMDVSSTHYSCSRWPSFWNFARFRGNSEATNDGEMQWLRL